MANILANNNSFFKIENCNIDELDKKINPEINLIICNNLLFEAGDNTYFFNDENHQIAYLDTIFSSNSKTLTILDEYFKNNKDEVIKAIINVINNFTASSITIKNKEYITDEILTAISNNRNIKDVNLKNSEDKIILDQKMFDILNNGTIENIYTDGVTDELITNPSPIIYYNKHNSLLRYYNYQEILEADELNLNDLKVEQIENLKYIPDEKIINLEHEHDFDKLFKIISECVKHGKHLHYKLSLNNDDHAEFNMALKNYYDEIINEDITIQKSFDKNYTLQQYVDYETRLTKLIEPAFNLSPFERYLYAYNVVKKFKEYKENKENPHEARGIFEILDSEYMVCVGYSVMLKNLLEKLGIEVKENSCEVYTGYDKYNDDIEVIPETLEAKIEGHARVIVNLVDEKYGINGIFIADPTWDNVMDQDAYNYALMNTEEFLTNNRYVLFSKYEPSELIMSQNIDEFYAKISFILNHNKTTDIKYIITSLLNTLKEIDNDLYTKIIKNYPELTSLGAEKTDERMNEILNILGTYFVAKSNTNVDGNTYKEAITVIYSSCYNLSGEELEEAINNTIEYNRKRQAKSFPKRYKIDENGEKVIYENENNKFDIENNNTKAL